ncbi:FAD/NAD(P)-binding protein [Streptomyces sp. AHU1]|uniref:FAD/NAD(P)-binding protein n=1 Tax=Streptomyces sp. AHU1 TaxID=3377215 RepID=UPI00387809D4
MPRTPTSGPSIARRTSARVISVQLCEGAARRRTPLDLILVDPAPEAGWGTVYVTEVPEHRVDVPVGGMSCCPDDLGRFRRRLCRHGEVHRHRGGLRLPVPLPRARPSTGRAAVASAICRSHSVSAPTPCAAPRNAARGHGGGAVRLLQAKREDPNGHCITRHRVTNVYETEEISHRLTKFTKGDVGSCA